MKLWKKVLAAVTAGMLCLGCAGVSGLQGVLGSVSAVLPVCAAENDTHCPKRICWLISIPLSFCFSIYNITYIRYKFNI